MLSFPVVLLTWLHVHLQMRTERNLPQQLHNRANRAHTAAQYSTARMSQNRQTAQAKGVTCPSMQLDAGPACLQVHMVVLATVSATCPDSWDAAGRQSCMQVRVKSRGQRRRPMAGRLH